MISLCALLITIDRRGLINLRRRQLGIAILYIKAMGFKVSEKNILKAFPITLKSMGALCCHGDHRSNPTTPRLAPVLKTSFHQCVTSYTCSHSCSDGSVLRTGSTRTLPTNFLVGN